MNRQELLLTFRRGLSKMAPEQETIEDDEPEAPGRHSLQRLCRIDCRGVDRRPDYRRSGLDPVRSESSLHHSRSVRSLGRNDVGKCRPLRDCIQRCRLPRSATLRSLGDRASHPARILPRPSGEGEDEGAEGVMKENKEKRENSFLGVEQQLTPSVPKAPGSSQLRGLRGFKT